MKQMTSVRMLLFLSVIYCCYQQVWTQKNRTEVAGISRNTIIECFSFEEDPAGSYGYFWRINNSFYGLLHVPKQFTVLCHQVCDLSTLIIPVVLSEMDGSIFQCVSIDYHTNTVYLGGVTQLEVVTLSPEPDIVATQRGMLEFDYTQYSVGPVNTTIGWTYRNLTCQPAVFTVEVYESIGDLTGQPVLTINSSSNTTQLHDTSNVTLYLRLLVHDQTGTNCAQDSTLVYYHLDRNVSLSISTISPSPEGVACVPIPVEGASGQDYSSLEVLWPETPHTPGKLCYCPPFEGDHHLFSRCINTSSCATHYSVAVRNDSVCFAGLHHELTSIPVYFTLLQPYQLNRCIIRSLLAQYIVGNTQTTPTTFEGMSDHTHQRETKLTTSGMSFTIITTNMVIFTTTYNGAGNRKLLVPAISASILPAIVLLTLASIAFTLCYFKRKRKSLAVNPTSEVELNENEGLYSSINNIPVIPPPPLTNLSPLQDTEQSNTTPTIIYETISAVNSVAISGATPETECIPTYNTLNYTLRTKPEASSTYNTLNYGLSSKPEANHHQQGTNGDNTNQHASQNATYSTLEGHTNKGNPPVIDSMIISEETNNSCNEVSLDGAAALYSTVDKTRKKCYHNPIMANTFTETSDNTAADEVAAMYSSVDKTRKKRNRIPVQHTMSDEATESHKTRNVTDNGTQEAESATEMPERDVSAPYGTVDKVRNTHNYHMVAVNSTKVDSDSQISSQNTVDVSQGRNSGEFNTQMVQ